MSVIQDPLLSCLVHLSKQNHKPFSPEVLCDGLPLENNKLTPKLFIRAAKRAGLSAQVLPRTLEEISPLVLPAVLLMENDQACIFQRIDQETGMAVVLQPESGGEHVLSLEDLATHYTGYAIFVRLEYRFQQQVSKLLEGHEGHWFWGTIKRSIAIYRDVLIASFLINIFVLINPLFVMNVYDRVVPNNSVETLWVLAIGVFIVYLFDFGLKMLRAYFIEIAGKKGDIILSALLFEKVLSLKYSSLPASVGSFASNLREFDSIKSFFSSTTNVIFIDLPFAILFLLVIGFIGGAIVIVPLVTIPLIILYSFVIRPRLKIAVEKTFASNAQKNSTLIESLTAMETVKTQRATSSIQLGWEQAVGYIAKWSLTSRMLSASVVNFAGFMQQITSVGIIITGVYLISEQEMTMGALVACVMLSGRAIAPMSQVANMVISFHQASTALKGLNDIMALPSERSDDKQFIYRKNLKGTIEFQEVSFSYPKDEQKALDKVSFNIKAGERVALIGRVGSGKSTIEKLVMGLYSADEGSVRVDGIDINQIDPVDLRRNFGYMPQDVMLFAGSVRDNIVIGSPQTDDDSLVDVANLTGVSGMVNRHPQGFDMPVGERGAALSGGQRQAVAVARSLIHKPNILILDEPTASMDNASEEQIKRILSDYTKERTLLLVTHKMALLSLVDRIIVMESGKIIADGSKEAVLEALQKGRLQVNK